MYKFILSCLFCFSVSFLFAQNDSFDLKIHKLQVPDRFQFETIQEIELDLFIPNFKGVKSIYQLYGIDVNGIEGLIMQGFYPENGHLTTKLKLPLHFEAIRFKIQDEGYVYDFDWEKKPLIRKNLLPNFSNKEL